MLTLDAERSRLMRKHKPNVFLKSNILVFWAVLMQDSLSNFSACCSQNLATHLHEAACQMFAGEIEDGDRF